MELLTVNIAPQLSILILNITRHTFTSCNGRNHGADSRQLTMRRHHSLCNDGSFVATEGKACQMALAVSCCYWLFDWLMALLKFGTSPTPTAMFASCMIFRATKGCVSHSETKEACREPIPPSLTERNSSSCPKNYISHSNSGGRPLWINTLSASSLGQSWNCHVTLFSWKMLVSCLFMCIN